MKFPYATIFTSRDRPVVPVFVERPGERRLLRGVLDTGADVTLLPYQLALDVGVKLGSPRKIGTAIGHTVSYRLGRVVLELRSPSETIRWQATVGFTPAALTFPLFGDRGFLEFFRCTFDGQLREVELTAEPNLPRIA